MRQIFTWLALIAMLSVGSQANAQLTGTKVVGSGGDYATLAAAVAAFNSQGVGPGGVTFSIKGGHTETVANGNTTPNPDVPAGLLITKGGTASNPVVFQWDGTGTKPVFTAGNGVGNYDFVIGIAGQDYITLDGLKIIESASHTTNTTRAEMGIALFKERYSTSLGNNGSQFVTIKNCEITLTRFPNYHVGAGYTHFNFQSTGIDLNIFTSTHQGSTSGTYYYSFSNPNLGIKTAADVHSNNTIIGNTIDNCVFGIKAGDGYLQNASVFHAGTGNVFGQSGAGNTITNFGPINGVSYGGTYHAAVAGIAVSGQKDFKVEYNNISGATGGNQNDNLRQIAGIFVGSAPGGSYAFPRSATGSFKVNNNTISDIDLTSNTTASLKFAIGIAFVANDNGTERAKASGNIEIKDNNISNLKGKTGDVVGINSAWYSDVPTTVLKSWRREGIQNGNDVTITGNTITGLTRQSNVRSGLLGAIIWKHSSKNLYINNNQITNFTLGSASLTPLAHTAGMSLIYTYSYLNIVTRQLLEIKSNTINNCSVLAPVGARNPVASSGIFAQSGGTSSVIDGNTIQNNNLYNSAYTNSVYHTDLIHVVGQPRSGTSTITINNNQLSSNSRTGLYAANGYGYQSQFRGIVADYTGGVQVKEISNNLIENMSQTANASNHVTSYSMIRGIYTSGKTTVGNTTSIFNNTVKNLSGPSSAYNKQIGTNSTTYYNYPMTGIAVEKFNILNVYNNNVTGLASSSVGWAAAANSAHGPTGIVAYNNTVSYNTTANIYNNFVSDLTAPSMQGRLAINGMVVSGINFRYNVYQNTIVLGAADGTSVITSSSAQPFSVTGLLLANYYYNNKKYLVDYRNNIISVSATAKSTAANMAVRNLVATAAKKVPLSIAKTSTGNVYYINSAAANYIYGQGTVYNTSGTGGIKNSYAFSLASTPVSAVNIKAYNLINDGVNFNTQCGTYRTFMSGAEKQSFIDLTAGNLIKPLPFVNSGTVPDNLKIILNSESYAFNANYIPAPVNVSTDYFSVSRPATKVTAGAYEVVGTSPESSGVIAFDFIPVQDNICGGNKQLQVTITPPTGKDIATGTSAPRLYFRRIYNNNSNTAANIDANAMPSSAQNNGASNFDGWRWVTPTGNSGNVYDFTIDLSLLNSSVATTAQYSIEYFLMAQTSDNSVTAWSSGDFSENIAAGSSTCPTSVQLDTYTTRPVPVGVSSGAFDENSVEDNYTIFTGQNLDRGLELVNNNAKVTLTGVATQSGPQTTSLTTTVPIGKNVKVIAHYATPEAEPVAGGSYLFEVATSNTFSGSTKFSQADSIFTYPVTVNTAVYIRANYSCDGVTAVPSAYSAYATITGYHVPVNTSTTADLSSCEDKAQVLALSSTADPAGQSRYYWAVSPMKKVFNIAPVANTTGTSNLSVTPGDKIHSGEWSSYVTTSAASALGKQGYLTSALDGSEGSAIDTAAGLALTVHDFVKLKTVSVAGNFVDEDDNPVTTPAGYKVSLYSAAGFKLYSQNGVAVASGSVAVITLTNWYIAPGDYVLVLDPLTADTQPTGGLATVTPDFPVEISDTGSPVISITSGVSDFAINSETGEASYAITSDYNYFFDLDVDSYGTSGTDVFNWTINPSSCCNSTPPAVNLVADGSISGDLATSNCKLINGWYYYFDPATPTTSGKLLAAVHPNGNAFNPTSVIVYNDGASSDGSHKISSGPSKTAEVMPYMLQIVNDGDASVNGGVMVKMFYPAAQKTIIDGYANSTWFKYSGSKQDVLDNLTDEDVTGKEILTASSTGTENGIAYVQFDGIESFSTFGFLGSITTPLPVTLVSFNASKEGSVSVLNWETTAESNSERFSIERSHDSKSWNEIGSRLAKGESNSSVKYSFTDDQPLQGANLYRLKMIDRDGTFAYSRIRNVNFTNGLQTTFYPNPVSEKLHLKADNWSEIKKIEIYSQNGKTVYKSGTKLVNEIDVKQFLPGVYTVRVQRINGEVTLSKVVVVR